MEKVDYYLALSVSHNSSAAIMRNGEIIAAVCEERYRRKKNYVGYPKQAVDYCLKKAGITGADIKGVAYTTIYNPGILVKAKTNTQFSLQNYRDYYGEAYYKRRLRNESCLSYLKWLRDDPQFNEDEEHFNFSYLSDEVLVDSEKEMDLFRAEQARVLAEHLGISSERVEFLDHHTCHAYYSYFGSPFRGKDCIVLTLDGWGDGRNQTVWLAKNDELSFIVDSTENDIGRIYKMATLILGMRPDEHEFKVMGLAPYAKSSYVEKAKKILENISTVKDMKILSKDRPSDLFEYLEDQFKTYRFDNIAGAVQAYTEELACKLVKNIADETGVRRFVIGGGIAMNIKMNKAISELKEVEELFVCGSSGDESLSIGGCYLLNSRGEHKNKPINNLYLGFDIRDEILNYDFTRFDKNFDVNFEASPEIVAGLLASGDIVAVVRGRAEFGARALGNRSILADPSRRESVQKINEAIKNRDFWMPFALSILEDEAEKYISNPKKLLSPFMAISLDVRLENHKFIEAGTHPYDCTVRPQFVSKIHAPEYYNLINAFKSVTGIPALLNTSFNLHGEPIVDNIDDAIRTFELSGLDHLLIEDKILLSKKRYIS